MNKLQAEISQLVKKIEERKSELIKLKNGSDLINRNDPFSKELKQTTDNISDSKKKKSFSKREINHLSKEIERLNKESLSLQNKYSDAVKRHEIAVINLDAIMQEKIRIENKMVM